MHTNTDMLFSTFHIALVALGFINTCWCCTNQIAQLFKDRIYLSQSQDYTFLELHSVFPNNIFFLISYEFE